jgi:hypothetical protein
LDTSKVPIIFWVPDTGTGAVHIEFSKNRALILMGDWCGSIYRSVTDTNEKFGCETETLSKPESVSLSKNGIIVCSGEVFFI